MGLKVEHELHARRRSRNLGVLAVLIAFVMLIFVLTLVKVANLGDMGLRNRMDPPAAGVVDPNYVAPEPAS